jgi:hypothetical protein
MGSLTLTRGPFGGKLAVMQTLGLSGESRRTDGRLKSIFWPTVENAWDVDYLGQQGFWICVAVAVIQVIGGAFSGNPIVLVTNSAIALVFLIGAMGVREASWPAAALIFGLYFVGILSTMAMGQLPGILSIIAAAVLLSNVRGAFLASQWRPAAEEEDRPMRFDESLRDKLVDQLPPKAWPILQVPFYALAAMILLLSLAGIGYILWHRLSGFNGAIHP